MNPNDSPPPSTAPSTSDESTSFYPRSPSSTTSISAVSDTSMEFTLHLLRTGDGEDDFQMWAVPVPSSNQAEHNAHAPQLWMEDLVAMIAQSDAFPFENNNPLVAGRSGGNTDLEDLSTSIEAIDENLRVTVAHDAGYDADDSSGMEEEHVDEDDERLFWIDVHWDRENGPLKEVTSHKGSRG